MEPFAEDSEVKPLVRLRLFAQNSRVKDEMKSQGITMEKLVSLTGLSYVCLSNTINLHKIPSENSQIRIAIALKKPIDYLFPEVLLNKVKAGAFDGRVKDLNPGQVLALPSFKQEQLLPYFPIEDVENDIQNQQRHKGIDEALEFLTPRERRVINLRFGLEDGISRTLEQVGLDFNVTRERIRGIEVAALKKLRHPRLSRRLRNFEDTDYMPPKPTKVSKKIIPKIVPHYVYRPEPVYPTLKPVKTHGYICPLCGYIFKNRNFETSHLLEVHPDLFMLAYRTVESTSHLYYGGYTSYHKYKVIICKLCEKSATPSPAQALRHLRQFHLNVYKKLKEGVSASSKSRAV